jgi:hypothetical protein
VLYLPKGGVVADGYIEFDRYRGTNTGQRAAAALPGVGCPTDGDYILVSTEANPLRISASAYKMINGATWTYGPSSDALGHADAIMITCSNSSTQTAGQPRSR